MQAIAINQTPINHTNGLYCLNDLHRAAGGENRHKPNLWHTNQQTQELIAEIEKAGNPAIQLKQGLGTFACRELVYAYAMWISPRFHLAVIRAFDALQAAPQSPAIPQTLPEALRLAADLAEQVQHQQARLVVAERQAAGLELLSERGNARNLTQAAKELKTNYRELLEHLRAKKWVCHGKPVYAAAKAIDAGYMLQVAGISERNGASYTQALITSKGLAKLAEHYGMKRQEQPS